MTESTKNDADDAPLHPAEGSEKPRSERTPLTLDRVVENARQLLAEKGFENLSLRGLAARLGVTAPALYAHVDDKLDLLHKLGDDGFRRLTEAFQPLEDGDPVAKIKHCARAYFDFAWDNPEQFRAMYLFEPTVVTDPDASPLESLTDAFGTATRAVQEAVDTGVIVSQNFAITNLTIWGTVHGITIVALAGSDLGREAAYGLLDNTVSAVLRGLAPEA